MILVDAPSMAKATSSWFFDIEPHNSGRKQGPDHQDVSTDAEEKAEVLLPKVSDVTDKRQRRSFSDRRYRNRQSTLFLSMNTPSIQWYSGRSSSECSPTMFIQR
jgi:hypothetical protein